MDKYETIKVLGAGENGKVFLVKNKITGKLYSKKVVFNHFRGREEIGEEIDILIKLSHPICKLRLPCLVEHFESAYRESILILEYREGETLSKTIIDSIEQAKSISIQLLENIKLIHSLGICHDDINSDNILITPLGEVYLIDFGMAVANCELKHSLYELNHILEEIEAIFKRILSKEDPFIQSLMNIKYDLSYVINIERFDDLTANKVLEDVFNLLSSI